MKGANQFDESDPKAQELMKYMNQEVEKRVDFDYVEKDDLQRMASILSPTNYDRMDYLEY